MNQHIIEKLKEIGEIIEQSREHKESGDILADDNIEISSLLYYLGELNEKIQTQWSNEFLEAKQTKNPKTGKPFTDKESECMANIKVPERDYLRKKMEYAQEFIKNTKVKIAVLQNQKQYSN